MRTGRIKRGYGMVQREIMIMPDVSVFSKAVYCLLVSYAGDKETCYPSLNTMVTNLGISKPTIIKAIKELIEIGLIIADKNKTVQGEHANNVYYPMYIMDEPVVNTVNHPVVNDINHLSKPDLPGVVKDVDPKNNTFKNSSLFNNKEQLNDLIEKFDEHNPTPKKKGSGKKESKPALLMRESIQINLDAVKFSLFGTMYEKANIEFYYEAALAWSDSKQQKSKDWLATIRNFMLRDMKAGNLVIGELSQEEKLSTVQDIMQNWENI